MSQGNLCSIDPPHATFLRKGLPFRTSKGKSHADIREVHDLKQAPESHFENQGRYHA